MSASADRSADPGPTSSAAAFTVTRGKPDAAAIAAVTAVLLAAGTAAGAAVPAEPPPRSLWADRARMLATHPRAAASSWRASALPG